jgi:hypothetical protein
MSVQYDGLNAGVQSFIIAVAFPTRTGFQIKYTHRPGEIGFGSTTSTASRRIVNRDPFRLRQKREILNVQIQGISWICRCLRSVKTSITECTAWSSAVVIQFMSTLNTLKRYNDVLSTTAIVKEYHTETISPLSYAITSSVVVPNMKIKLLY